MNFWKIVLLIGLSSYALGATGAEKDVPEDPADKPLKETGGRPSKGALLDYGPVLASSLAEDAAGGKAVWIADKALTIKVGEGAFVAFDTELMRYVRGWTGTFLDLTKTHMSTEKGDRPPRAGGPVVFKTRAGPGWSKDASFADTRKDPMHPGRGPLPKEHAHYEGMYLNGDRVVLSYTVGGVRVLEMPGAAKVDGVDVFTRTIKIGPTTEPLRMLLADGAMGLELGFAQAPRGSFGMTLGNRLFVSLPALPEGAVFGVAFGAVDLGKLSTFADGMKIVDPSTLIGGGPARWGKTVETRGVLAVSPKADAKNPEPAYVVDTLPVPEENPWSSWMRTTAFDFFADGKSAAVCTWNGDVWVVSGIDEKLEKLTWRRFAAGLYEPLGLKIVGDKVYVQGRDQITRLHDLNADGEADFYENFNNDTLTCPQYHHFKFDLDTDAAGNFYYASGWNWTTNDYVSDYGCIVKVSPDGKRVERIGRGFRAPNGMAVGPNGEIAIGDNQGFWMPSSKINLIPPGKSDGFYGFAVDPRTKDLDMKTWYPNGLPTTFDPPMCWVPYFLDSSSGGQAFVTGDKWGPLKGGIVHTSYSKSSLFYAMHETVDGVAQGGVWRFPLTFDTGIQRARFNPGDGQLYVVGLRGWQTNGARDGCLQRVRYTGKSACVPIGLRATEKGLYVTFTDALDPETANDAGSYDVEQWNYRWSIAYGSADYSVENPTKKGRDTVEVTSAKLQADGRTVFLEMPGIGPVMQMGVTYTLKSKAGGDVDGAFYNTINKLGK